MMCGRVDVLRAEPRAERQQHPVDVLAERPVGRDLPERRLPEVAVGVHQPGQHDPVGRVDDPRPRRRDPLADGHDRVTFDQHVAAWQIADAGIDAVDGATLDEGSLCHR
jgi:hypothetical protein